MSLIEMFVLYFSLNVSQIILRITIFYKIFDELFGLIKYLIGNVKDLDNSTKLKLVENLVSL